MDFDEIYRGYVIREKNTDYFIGPTTAMFRVSVRSWAMRFTKKEAMEYIQHGKFCKKGEFVIEDAV